MKIITALMTGMFLVVLSGCGEESLVKTTGKTVGGAIREFGSGAGEGIENKKPVEVRCDRSIKNFDMENTIARTGGNFKDGQTVEIYLTGEFTSWVLLTMQGFDKQNREIGRAKVEKQFAGAFGEYLTFKFPQEMVAEDVAYYTLKAEAGVEKPAK